MGKQGQAPKTKQSAAARKRAAASKASQAVPETLEQADAPKSSSLAPKIQTKLKEELVKRDVANIIKRRSPLFGLFVPYPHWPQHELTVDSLLQRGLPRLAFFLAIVIAFAVGLLSVLVWLGKWILVIMLPATLYGACHKAKHMLSSRKVTPSREAPIWHTNCADYFSPNSAEGRQRRHEAAEAAVAGVAPAKADKLNEHVRNVTGIAVYGCGILAAAHVGGLRALERHGMQYTKLRTLAGVSAGSVVVAMIAVGYTAEELFELLQTLPFPRLGRPELGSVMRAVGNILQDVLKRLLGDSAAVVVECLAGGTGPGLNSGKVLEDMIGQALVRKCGDEYISLGAVKERYNKRLVIIVCELDTGKERHLTPETDADLPVKVAVRMSMGVPGLMEPYGYRGHVYCDGGICNDFPMNALPEGESHIGLMIRPLDWIINNFHAGGPESSLKALFPSSELDEFQDVKAYLSTTTSLSSKSLWSVKSAIDLVTTMIAIMMDANLMLQISQVTNKRSLSVSEQGLSELAPEILTICGGRLDPFDFNLTRDQHLDLYYSGQLCVHIHANAVDRDCDVMPASARLRALLFLLQLDYPNPAE